MCGLNEVVLPSENVNRTHVIHYLDTSIDKAAFVLCFPPCITTAGVSTSALTSPFTGFLTFLALMLVSMAASLQEVCSPLV